MKKLLKLSGTVFLIVLLSALLCGYQKAEVKNAPVDADTVAAALEQTDLSWTIAIEDSWREDQKAYELHDEQDRVTAAISSAGDGAGRFLQIVLFQPDGEQNTDADEEEELKQMVLLAGILYGGFEDENQLYGDFCMNFDGTETWSQEYGSIHCTVCVNAADGVRDIVLYNTEKYNPSVEARKEEEYSDADPEILVEEIEEIDFLNGYQAAGKDKDELLYDTEEEECRFYRISIRDNSYSKNYPVDLSVFLAENSAITNDWETDQAVTARNAEDEYEFSMLHVAFTREEREITGVVLIPRVEILNQGKVEAKEEFDYHIVFRFDVESGEVLEVKSYQSTSLNADYMI
ncbi:MAG: hypothetical protein Q4C59_12705 [Lachnospiraceae bacterium]|nr:hypothetical protein [Lachnospiraceae bacterium]